MNPILMTLALVAALTVFTYSVALRLGALMRLRPENRLDRPWQRLGVLLKVGFGQSRLIGRQRERASGAMHFFIFWGFIILGLREIIIFGEAFSKGFQELLPLLGSDSVGGYLYTLVYNVFEAIVLCMVVFALYRRIGLRPKRLDLSMVGNVILFLIVGVVATDLLYDAAKFNLIGR